MSHSHIEHCLDALLVGVPEGMTITLADFDIPEAQVLALDAGYVLDADDSYCPLSDIPDFITAVGVYERDAHAYIVGDNGNYLFMFRLTKQ